LTYGILGALVGTFGSAIGSAASQQTLSIIAGALLILIVLLSWIDKRGRFTGLEWLGDKVRSLFSRFYKKGGSMSLFMIGMINGFLPCGLVYTALVIALATGSSLYGFLVMVVFGLGTFPMMYVLSIFRKFMSQLVWKKFSKWSSLFVLLIGILFVLRGLNLGIPYLSPYIDHTEDHIECCHPGE